MAFERREYQGSAIPTTTTGSLTTGDLTIGIAASTGWPTGGTGPFAVTIDRGLATEEKVLVTSRTGLTLTVSGGNRGHDGTAASAHASGATIEHTIMARDMDEANQHYARVDIDQHTQYIRTDGTRAFSGVSAVAGGVPPASNPGDAGSAGSGVVFSLSTHSHPREAAAFFPGDLKKSVAIGAAPTGWLLCNGQSVSKTTYAALYAALGSASSPFGSADAFATVFNVPDFRKRFAMGVAASGAVGLTLGSTGGSADAIVPTHAHTADQHAHSGTTGNENSSLAHTHATDSPGDHRHGFAGDTGFRFLGSLGGSADKANAAAGGTQTPYTFSNMDLAGNHSHTALSNGPAVHTHNVTVGNASVTSIQATGVAVTDGRLPSFIAVNYLIKT